MRRPYFLMLAVFGMTVAVFGQGTSSDSQRQTLQALLSEVRELHGDLQGSLGRIQSAQLLLSRLQIQEVAVTRASQHLDDARSKLAEVQVVVTSETDQVKRLEASLEAPGDRAAQIQDALDQAKSDLAVSTNLEQQRQSIESGAEQQLQTEQDRLSRLEAQLDDAVKVMNNSTETLRPVPHS